MRRLLWKGQYANLKSGPTIQQEENGGGTLLCSLQYDM